MIISILSLLAGTGLTGPASGPAAAAPPTFHQIAFVTDTLSHGVVGDGYLSLNEAIRLHNGTLLVTQLSTAEQAQVSLLPGSLTTDVTWIDIDSEAIPTIVVQQDLDSIVNTPFGLFIRGAGGRVTLDLSGPGITRGIHSTSSSLVLQGLKFSGGPAGLEVVQADATGQPGCTVLESVFDGQSQFGIKVNGTLAGGVGRLIVEDCSFVNVPDAISLDESPADRTTIFEARDVRITGASSGFDFDVGTGGTARFTLDRCVVECTGTGVDLVAPATNGRPLLVEGTHLRVRAAMCARIDGAADAVTWMQGSMWNLLATAGGVALELGSVGDRVYGDLREFRCVGDVTIGTGAAPLPLEVRNLRVRDGAVTLSTLAGQTFEVSESRFVDCVTETVGTGAVTLLGSSFEGGSLGAASAAGLLQANGCYVANPGPGVAATASLGQAFLGSMAVSPDDAPYGGTIQFSMDLPAGLVGAFALGTVPQFVPIFPAPYHIYLDPSVILFLPGVYVGQQSTSWLAPAQPVFFGAELIVQAAVLPISVQAPAIQLPPGWRFEIR
ncbi:MAG: hypothetical protein KAI24_08810 [Planctomycetes bacterium]|nr:hypothetical protein [Planctomycetota bacterium]